MSIHIEKILKTDQEQVSKLVKSLWGDETILVHREVFCTKDIPGLKALKEDQIVGFLHYQVRDEECEILTLASLKQRQGIGSALLLEVEFIARKQGCQLLSLVTTNDNLNALGFYQKRGFHLAALAVDQVAKSRHLKPSIPLIGDEGIPIRDEIRLEKALT